MPLQFLLLDQKHLCQKHQSLAGALTRLKMQHNLHSENFPTYLTYKIQSDEYVYNMCYFIQNTTSWQFCLIHSVAMNSVPQCGTIVSKLISAPPDPRISTEIRITFRQKLLLTSSA